MFQAPPPKIVLMPPEPSKLLEMVRESPEKTTVVVSPARLNTFLETGAIPSPREYLPLMGIINAALERVPNPDL